MKIKMQYKEIIWESRHGISIFLNSTLKNKDSERMTHKWPWTKNI